MTLPSTGPIREKSLVRADRIAPPTLSISFGRGDLFRIQPNVPTPEADSFR